MENALDYTNISRSDVQERNAQDAFKHAIAVGELSTDPKAKHFAGKFMFMYAAKGGDFFKHVITRNYIKVSH